MFCPCNNRYSSVHPSSASSFICRVISICRVDVEWTLKIPKMSILTILVSTPKSPNTKWIKYYEKSNSSIYVSFKLGNIVVHNIWWFWCSLNIHGFDFNSSHQFTSYLLCDPISTFVFILELMLMLSFSFFFSFDTNRMTYSFELK
jgi:hypothetical protein